MSNCWKLRNLRILYLFIIIVFQIAKKIYQLSFVLKYFYQKNTSSFFWLLLSLLFVHFFNINCYFIFLHYTVHIMSFNCWKSSYCRLGPCHILRVVSVAIFIILLIFLMLLTVVFSNNGSISDNALINFFLLLSASISSSKPSCTDSARSLKRPKVPFVELLSLFSCLMSCSVLSVIFGNNSACKSWHFQISHRFFPVPCRLKL